MKHQFAPTRALSILVLSIALSSFLGAQTYRSVSTWGGPGGGGGNLNDPTGIAVDQQGNVYVSDALNCRVQKFSSSGQYMTMWGVRGSTHGNFVFPMGIAVDSAGNLYVADVYRNAVQKFSSSGTYISELAVSGVGVAISKDGFIYVVKDSVYKFAANGARVLTWGKPGSGVAVDDSGNVYVAAQIQSGSVGTDSLRVYKYSSGGNLLTTWNYSPVCCRWGPLFLGIVTDTLGFVYLSNLYEGVILKYTSTGQLVSKIASSGSGNGQFKSQLGMARTTSGTMVVSDAGNSRIQEITRDGQFVRKWGAFGGMGDGNFNFPHGLAVDSVRKVIYVADFWDCRIQKFSLDGGFIMKWGSNGTDSGKFTNPEGIAVDRLGNVYVNDAGMCRIQKFDSTGRLMKLWGRQGSGVGQFQRNSGIAVDKDNNVYVTDGNDRVQKFSSDGTFLLQWGSTGTADGQFIAPRGVTIDGQGFVYVVDHGTYGERSRVQKFTSAGSFVTKWDLGINQWDGSPRLAGMSIDKQGNLFAVDDGEKKIYRFNPAGVLLAKWDCADPAGLGVDGTGAIYIVSGQDGGSIVTKYALYGQDYTVPTLAASSPLSIVKGSEFTVDVRIADSVRVASVFGLGFDLSYTNTSFVDFVAADTSSCFLGAGLLYILTPDDASGKVSIGLARKAPATGVLGGGLVAKLRFRVSTTAPDNGAIVFGFAKVSSIDSNGNSIFLTPISDTTSITPNLNVWPGDIDNSGIVNQNDLLPLGVYWGKTGLPRSNASVQWNFQSAIPWFPSGSTFADANGDGIVNQADVLPIGLNWGKTRPVITTQMTSARSNTAHLADVQGTPVLRAIGPISVRGKSTFDVNVMLGDTVSLVSSLFGISFVLDFAGSKGTIQATEATSGSLLGNDVIFYPQIDNAGGNVAIGVTRKSGGGEVTGFGQLAKIKFEVVNNTSSSSFGFTTRDIAANDGNGNALVVQASSNTVFVSINDATQVPGAYRLDQNFPNPFNPSTRIAYAIPKSSRIRLSILDVLGREVAVLVNGEQAAGSYESQWEAGSLSSGVYFYRLEAGPFVQSKKMLLLR